MYLGVDIGGTKILCLVVEKNGRVRGRAKKKVKDRGPEAVLRRAWRCAGEALAEAGIRPARIKAIGLAVPSAVSDGVALFAPALGWSRAPVVEMAGSIFPWPVHLGNDVNLGLAAEYCRGAARGGEVVSGFFVGTGVGGAVIHQGRLVRGKDGMAGELGHLVVVPGGRRCGCGNRGCLEAYASKTGFLRRIQRALFEENRRSSLRGQVRRRTEMVSSRQLLTAYQARDKLAREIIDDGIDALGVAAANVINALAPSHLVLGGGVVEAFGGAMVRRVRAAARPCLFGSPRRAGVIVQSALGDDAVPIGAALLAQGEGRLLD